LSQTSPSGRRAPRVTTRLSGEILGRSTQVVSVFDLSRSGCLVRTEKRLAADAVIDLRFQLEDGELLAKARVVESSIDGASLQDGRTSYLSGLRFLDLKPYDEQRLLRYLSQNTQQARED
jgi:c-di-GMP-binding flagellar brake protein YcgR